MEHSRYNTICYIPNWDVDIRVLLIILYIYPRSMNYVYPNGKGIFHLKYEK